MKNFLNILVCLSTFVLIPPVLTAQETETSYRQVLTREDILLKQTNSKSFVETPPPFANPRNVAEFEPMEAVLVRYPFGISYSVIAEMSQSNTVWTIANGTGAMNTVITNYTNNGVNLSNCKFINAPSDTYWTRDYGPWFVQYTDSLDVLRTGIIDFPYNRPTRVYDDEIPKKVADSLNIEWFGMNIIHTGGNYMTTGMGIAASTQLVLEENPTQTQAQISQKALDYLGVSTYHAIYDPNNTYIDHIDCWGKFLAPDKVLIRSVPPSHPQYDTIEMAADFFATHNSPYGAPFKVYRVFTPTGQPYTNSLILNNKVFVPIMNQIQYDTAALHVYETAMPGYEVLGFTGSWQSTDALHCRAIGLADRGMLYIEHSPVANNQPSQTNVDIIAKILNFSGMGLYPDSVLLIYNVNGGNDDSLIMSPIGNDQYSASIPGQALGSEVHYSIHAADSSGRKAAHPIMAMADPHKYQIGTVGMNPDLQNPASAVIHTCMPNPFRNIVLFDFSIKQMEPTSVEVFDLNGRMIKTLIRQSLGPGFYSLPWDASDESGNIVPPGIYTIRMCSGSFAGALKVIFTGK